MLKKNENSRSSKFICWSAFAAVFFAFVLGAGPANAYCRTSSCADGKTGARCMPAAPTDCGIELFWKSPCVSFSMQKDASAQVPLAVATNVFEQAFQAWANVDCGGGKHPRITAVNFGTVECDAHEYNKKAGNANIILFQDATWPHVGANTTLALTTVTYNVDTGEIYDADMELNSANVSFTMDDKIVKYDLASIAAHETGHFLGLSHSSEGAATMYLDYTPGSTQLRTLEADDIAAICAAYPPGDPIPSSCDATPRRGFETECSPPPIQTEDPSCAMTPGASRTSASLAAISLMVLGALLGRRRHRRHRP